VRSNLMGVRYTICTYYPDLARPALAYDFAVLAASPQGIALVGVNVADAYGLQERHPLAKAIAEQTFQIVVRRIQRSLQHPGPHACLDVLDRIVEGNLSNIQYRSIAEAEGDDAEVTADRVFREIRQKAEAVPPGDGARKVLRFSQGLNGTISGTTTENDHGGTEVREASVQSYDPASQDVDQQLRERPMMAKPLVLRLDEADRRAVAGGMPAYVAYGLRYSATKLVQSATVMYPGLRRVGRLREGYAFCGRLQQAYGNEGEAMSPPDGMVYVVYVDPDGYVFDWDWVQEERHHPGYPIDTELRFMGDPVAPAPEAVLVGVEDLAPARPFDPRQAHPSPRGDCIFCYFREEFAFADRIDNDLTVFRSRATGEPTGFKIKNVERMLEEGRIQLAAPDLDVEVQAFLLASLLRNPNSKIEVYSILIGAWMRQIGHTGPPKIRVPRAGSVCSTRA
jgi:hypothetical protein